jgi:hypothetical protein
MRQFSHTLLMLLNRLGLHIICIYWILMSIQDHGKQATSTSPGEDHPEKLAYDTKHPRVQQSPEAQWKGCWFLQSFENRRHGYLKAT